MRKPSIETLAIAGIVFLALIIAVQLCVLIFSALRDSFAILSQVGIYGVPETILNLALGTPGHLVGGILILALLVLIRNAWVAEAPVVVLWILGAFCLALFALDSFAGWVRDQTDFPTAIPLRGDFAEVARKTLISARLTTNGLAQLTGAAIYSNRSWLFDGVGTFVLGYIIGRGSRRPQPV